MTSQLTNHASLLERGFAYIVDGIVLFIGVVIVVLALAPVLGEGAQLVALPIVATYYIYSEATWGQTPGKMVLGIRVVQTNGTECGWGGSILRNLTKLLGGTLIATLVAIVLILVTDDSQRVGDLLADTTVVES